MADVDVRKREPGDRWEGDGATVDAEKRCR